ncbi:MAG: hypothetical protein LUC91_01830 [Prevotella sp.]|nr:hypothetical protein [Prevotella sp.]
MNKYLNYIVHPKQGILALSAHGLLPFLSDKKYIEIAFEQRMGYKLDLNNPKTFNEKLQWLKLYNRRPEYTQMVDKYEAKKYVASIIGDEFIIPTLGVWDRFDDIDFDTLPNQFVLKCTHDSGGLIICRDKSKLDIKACREKLNKSLNMNYFLISREWPYKDVKPRIIAEKYMVDESGYELKDYKVFNFDGKAKVIQVDYERFSNHMRNLYTTEWEYIEAAIQYPANSERRILRPEKLNEMIELAEKLSKGIPHLRTDFYSIEDKLYFGELTFYHGSGFEKFIPEEFGLTMGSYIQIPKGGGILIKHDGFILWLHKVIDAALKDYKLHCFNGQPKITLVCTGRFTDKGLREDFFDNDWQHLNIQRPKNISSNYKIGCPHNFELMKTLASRLSKDIPFLRVDFYEIHGKVYFGEMTFFPASGLKRFIPNKCDRELGNLLKLPIICV